MHTFLTTVSSQTLRNTFNIQMNEDAQSAARTFLDAAALTEVLEKKIDMERAVGLQPV